jgi:hypothetical protein
MQSVCKGRKFGQTGTLDRQRVCTGRKSGQAESLDRHGAWTSREYGQAGFPDMSEEKKIEIETTLFVIVVHPQ